jgi:hypothetical protein
MHPYMRNEHLSERLIMKYLCLITLVAGIVSPAIADMEIWPEEYGEVMLPNVYSVNFGPEDRERNSQLRVSLAVVWDEYQILVEDLFLNDGTGNRGFRSGYRINGEELADLFSVNYIAELRFVRWEDSSTFVIANRVWNGYHEYTETFQRFTYLDNEVFFVRMPSWDNRL